MSTNADRIFDQYYNGSYAHKGDQLRLRDDEIYSKGTLIGKIENLEYYDGYYENFLVLSLRTFKSQKNWKTHQKQLAKAANEAGMPVIIVPELDIGFGLEDTSKDVRVIIYNSEELITVAKYSQDEDVKTAVCAIKHGNFVTSDKVIAFSYNQYIDGEWMHAEDILCKYLECKELAEDDLEFHTLLEPCYDCLKAMILSGGHRILFAACHKDKWNTSKYIQYVNDIQTKEVRSNSGRPVTYFKFDSRKANKFYNLEDKK